MSSARYIFNYKSHKPELCQIDANTYRIGGNTPIHWMDKAYGYRCDTQEACFWVDGKFIYPINPDGTPTGSDPVLYYGD
ncbi:hypothetical protein [Neorhizobium sp. JUb45]|uniref:hypothetical protein n=1 Tax=Neorhizobium sp. JUb45 TaxID=2485113 RepID=UPI001051FCE0|nr:hypothetical protein [Neorhizobium sp. JUb45]TCR04075.1 hypothetical protein EDF70_102171 [Neorhizobium sp. JUb45]